MTIERLIAIKFPLQVQFMFTRGRLFILICAITLITFGMTFHHWIAYSLKSKQFCNGTQTVYWSEALAANSTVGRYIKISTVMSAVFVVAGPMLTLLILNFSLIAILRSHRRSYGTENKRTNTDRARQNGNNYCHNVLH